MANKAKAAWIISETEKIKGTQDASVELKEMKGLAVVILGSKELSLRKYFRNIKKVEVTNSLNLNTYQVMKGRQLLFTEAALEEVVKKYVD